MNNKDVMVGSITEAWLLHGEGMCPTTYSIACTAGVLAVMNHLLDEQAAHEETKSLLKERMTHQEGLELRLGNAERTRIDVECALRDLQSEIGERQTYIEQLEGVLERYLNGVLV